MLVVIDIYTQSGGYIERSFGMRTKYLPVALGYRYNISHFPSFHRSGNIVGMKRKFYGKNALLVRCGEYIYDVTDDPRIYAESY